MAGGLEIYDSAGLLPTSGVTNGTQAYVTANQKLYIRATGGWYNVATVNTTPTISSVADASSNTSPFDLVKGLKVNFNGAVKSTSSNTICCSDIQRMYGHGDYTLIVGVYDQVDNEKVFHTEYEFYIKKEDFSKLWGNTSVEKLNEYVNKIKAVEHGVEAQTEYQKVAEVWKQGVSDDNALFVINPKVDTLW